MKPGSILKEKQKAISLRLSGTIPLNLWPGKIANPKMYIMINCHPDDGTFLVYDLFDGKVKRSLRDYMERNYEVIA